MVVKGLISVVGSTGSKLAAGCRCRHGGGPRRPGGTQLKSRGAQSAALCNADSTPLDATYVVCILLLAALYILESISALYRKLRPGADGVVDNFGAQDAELERSVKYR